jgi:hypothetical protein
MNVQSLSPVLFCEAIEPSLPFWIEGLGFHVTTEVPEGDALGFVILEREGIQVMLQTRASVQADLPDRSAAVRWRHLRATTRAFLVSGRATGR